MNKVLFFLAIVLMTISCGTKNVLVEQLKSDDALYKIAKDPKHEVQILYTRVNLADTSFTSYAFNVMPDQYFYPASTVKMPVAILALQRLQEINKEGVDVKRTDDMMHAAKRPSQTFAILDSTTVSGKPNIERYIQKIFAVSDNDAFNRLYEFLGQDYINESLRNKGVFTTSVINHRLSVTGYTPEENKHTNNARFFRDNKMIYDKADLYASRDWFHAANGSMKGLGYMSAGDSIIAEPFDFSKKNYYSIGDMEATIKRVIFPQKFSAGQKFDLKDEDYSFLKEVMSDLPRSDAYYGKDTAMYYDSYVKFLMFGDSTAAIPDHIKIYNKVGSAYGYLTDCAYIEDSQNKIAFFLTATIHVNANQIYNDGVYEYDQVGKPFLGSLGRMIYNYELAQKGIKP